jgi:hypothetical protein
MTIASWLKERVEIDLDLTLKDQYLAVNFLTDERATERPDTSSGLSCRGDISLERDQSLPGDSGSLRRSSQDL